MVALFANSPLGLPTLDIDLGGSFSEGNLHGSFDIMIPGLAELWAKMLTSAPVRAFSAVVAVMGKLGNILAIGLAAVKKVVKVAFEIAQKVFDAVLGFMTAAFSKLAASFADSDSRTMGKFCLNWERFEELKIRPSMDASFPSVDVGVEEIARAKANDASHDWEQFRDRQKLWPACGYLGPADPFWKRLNLPKGQQANLERNKFIRHEFAKDAKELGCGDGCKRDKLKERAVLADIVCGHSAGYRKHLDGNMDTAAWETMCPLLRAPPECCDEMLAIASNYAFAEFDEEVLKEESWFSGVSYKHTAERVRNVELQGWNSVTGIQLQKSRFYCWMAAMTARDDGDLPTHCVMMRDQRVSKLVALTYKSHTVHDFGEDNDHSLDMAIKDTLFNLEPDFMPDEKGYVHKCRPEKVPGLENRKCYKDRDFFMNKKYAWNIALTWPSSTNAPVSVCPKPVPTCTNKCWPKTQPDGRLSAKCRAAAINTPMKWKEQQSSLLKSMCKFGRRCVDGLQEECRCGYWGWAIQENVRRLKKGGDYPLLVVPPFKGYSECIGGSEHHRNLEALMGNSNRERQQQEDDTKNAMPRSLDLAAAMTSNALLKSAGKSGVSGLLGGVMDPGAYTKKYPKLKGRCEKSMKDRLTCPADKKSGLHAHFQADLDGFTAMICWMGHHITHTCFSWKEPPCIRIPIDTVAMITLNICPSYILDVECGGSNMLGVLDVRLSVGLKAYGLKKLSFDVARVPVWPKIATSESCHRKSKPEEIIDQPLKVLGVTLTDVMKTADLQTGEAGQLISDTTGINLAVVKRPQIGPQE